MIRVLLADDQEMVRVGFRMILDTDPEIEVVGEAPNGAEAVRLASELGPDVVLMDIRMPELDGLEATRQIADGMLASATGEPVRVVVVTTFDLDEYVDAAITNGAAGFLLKDAGPALLIEAVKSAVRGDVLISPSITVRLLSHFAGVASGASGIGGAGGLGGAGGVPAQPIVALTEREEGVLREVATGLTNAEIADSLYISLSTVKTHLGSIQDKVGARNRVELAAWAWRTGRMG